MLSAQTIRILGNFSKINNRIEFMPGREIRVMNVMRSIFAMAVLNQTIPKTFAIADVASFLRLWRSVSSKVSKPGVAWDDGGTESDNVLDELGRHPAIILKNFSKSETYRTDEVLNRRLYEKNIWLKEDDIRFSFILSPVIMKDAIAKAEELSLPYLSFFDKTIAVNHILQNRHKVVYDLPQMKTKTDEDGEARLSIRRIQMIMPLYYQVDCAKGYCRFHSINSDYDVTYFISTEVINL